MFLFNIDNFREKPALETESPDVWATAGFFTIAVAALGVILQINKGSYSFQALFWLTLGLWACLLGVTQPKKHCLTRFGERQAKWEFSCYNWR